MNTKTELTSNRILYTLYRTLGEDNRILDSDDRVNRMLNAVNCVNRICLMDLTNWNIGSENVKFSYIPTIAIHRTSNYHRTVLQFISHPVDGCEIV